MSTLFALISTAALICAIVFFVKSSKVKKAGGNNSPEKKKAWISVAVWFVALIIFYAVSPDVTTSVEAAKQESVQIVEDTTEADTLSPDAAETSEEESKTDFVTEHDNEIIAAAKMTLDNYITDYDMSLAAQRWTIAKFDETDTTVIAATEITYGGVTGTYYFVGTMNLDDSGKVVSATPHYLEVNGTVLGDDGYCDEVFDKIRALGGQ